MAKNKIHYRCSDCGWTAPKWVGQCRECGAWSTLEQVDVTPSAGRAPSVSVTPVKPAEPINAIATSGTMRSQTGVPELDRVLGGGLVAGAVILLTGEPGIGKSTLLLDVASRAAAASGRRAGGPALYITGEESASQVRLRADRIDAMNPNLLLAAETDVTAVLGHVERHRPSLLVVDSVQTLAHPQLDGPAGGVSQVRAVAQALIGAAKQQGIPVILVGHVTKDGTVAGPRVLEHLVDVVCHFEGERHAQLRLLRALKNRYGATDEVGCFEMRDDGIKSLADPAGLFLEQIGADISGTCVTVTLEGRRPLASQVQALVANTAAGSPRRTTSGVDHSRVAMVLAVLQARVGVNLSGHDVYVSTVGGAKTTEPGADLAIALALVSSAQDRAPRHGLVVFGEVGLTGQIRSVTNLGRRLTEAHRLGFTDAIVPKHGFDETSVPKSMRVHTVDTLREAVRVALSERG